MDVGESLRGIEMNMGMKKKVLGWESSSEEEEK